MLAAGLPMSTLTPNRAGTLLLVPPSPVRSVELDGRACEVVAVQGLELVRQPRITRSAGSAARRGQRMAGRRAAWRVSTIRAVASCGRYARQGVVEVHRLPGEDGGSARAALTGLMTCSSVWACPVCAAHIMQARAEDITTGAGRHRESAGALGMLTLTLRHKRTDTLAQLLGGLLDSWRRVINGEPWKRACAKFGVVGFVRSTEITYGAANGWHPHLHVLMVYGQPISDEQREEFEFWIYERWAGFVEKYGLGIPTRKRGALLQAIDADGADYGFKLQERTLGWEMARGDLKRGRADRYLPFELLWAAGNGEVAAVELWHEYEQATQGRRASHWSKGLRELWRLGDERADEEITADDHTTGATLVGLVEEEDWAAVIAHGADGYLLELIETARDLDHAAELLDGLLHDARSNQPDFPTDTRGRHTRNQMCRSGVSRPGYLKGTG